MKQQPTLAGLSLAPIGIAAALIVSAITAAGQSLGPATGYNYLVFGDVSISNSDVEGRAAIGGNASFTNYGVGDKLPSGTGGYSLVVGGNLSFHNGQVFQGSAIYGGSSNTSGFGIPNGSLVQGSHLDFASAQSELTSLSGGLSGLDVNGSFHNDYGTLLFTGTDNDLNTFIVQADAVNTSHGFRVNAPSGSTVVINVAGTSIDWNNMQIFLTGTDKQHIVYNFYEATNLNISGISVQGSILAPHADVIFNNGNIEGTLVSKSLSGTGEFHHHPFEGNLPIPEPSTALLSLVGATLLFRRRR